MLKSWLSSKAQSRIERSRPTMFQKLQPLLVSTRIMVFAPNDRSDPNESSPSTQRPKTREAQNQHQDHSGEMQHFHPPLGTSLGQDQKIDETSATCQLFQCAETELGGSFLEANPKITDESLHTLLAAKLSLAVIPVAGTSSYMCAPH